MFVTDDLVIHVGTHAVEVTEVSATTDISAEDTDYQIITLGDLLITDIIANQCSPGQSLLVAAVWDQTNLVVSFV